MRKRAILVFRFSCGHDLNTGEQASQQYAVTLHRVRVACRQFSQLHSQDSSLLRVWVVPARPGTSAGETL